jgi:hypothetical protein
MSKVHPGGTKDGGVGKPAETQTSIELASYSVRVPNSRSGGHEFESPMRRELGALTKVERLVECFSEEYDLRSYFFNTETQV